NDALRADLRRLPGGARRRCRRRPGRIKPAASSGAAIAASAWTNANTRGTACRAADPSAERVSSLLPVPEPVQDGGDNLGGRFTYLAQGLQGGTPRLCIPAGQVGVAEPGAARVAVLLEPVGQDEAVGLVGVGRVGRQHRLFFAHRVGSR